jgi:hypothetical protein
MRNVPPAAGKSGRVAGRALVAGPPRGWRRRTGWAPAGTAGPQPPEPPPSPADGHPGANPPGPAIGGRVAPAGPDPRPGLPGPVDPPAPLPARRVCGRRPGRDRHGGGHRRRRPGRLPAGRDLPGRHLGLRRHPGRAARARPHQAARPAPGSAAGAGPGRPLRHGPGLAGVLVARVGRGRNYSHGPSGRSVGDRGRRAGRVRQDHAGRPPPRPTRPLPRRPVRAHRRQGRPRLQPPVPRAWLSGKGDLDQVREILRGSTG